MLIMVAVKRSKTIKKDMMSYESKPNCRKVKFIFIAGKFKFLKMPVKMWLPWKLQNP